MSKIVIIGGVAGGASAAARLRRLDEKAEIILVERGSYISYANCGLPYHVGSVIKESSKLQVTNPINLTARFNVDVRINSEAVEINRKSKQIIIKNIKTGDEYTESYDTAVIATGTEPIISKFDGLPDKRSFLIRDIPETIRLREAVVNETVQSAVVVGGGFLGIEMAENLQLCGVRTYLIEKDKQIFAAADKDIAILLEKEMKKSGVEIFLDCEVKDAILKDDKVCVSLSTGERLPVDIIVMATGVRPASKLAAQAGLELNKSGAIVTNEYLQTSDPNIYAVGDVAAITDMNTGEVIPRYLAGPANKQGRIAADNISGRKVTYAGTLGSSVVKAFDGVVALTGYNEKQLKRSGIKYEKVYTHATNHATYYPNSKPINLKLLFSPENGRILGAQAYGEDGVEKRIDIIATAIYAKLTVFDLEKLDLCYAPPFSSAKDPVNVAGYCAANVMKNDVKIFQCDEVADFVRKGEYLIDVRTQKEFASGHIDTAVNIPLDDLRNRLNELPNNKMINVYCKVGLRGYIACRILTNNGFEVRNLTGGWQSYKERNY